MYACQISRKACQLPDLPHILAEYPVEYVLPYVNGYHIIPIAAIFDLLGAKVYLWKFWNSLNIGYMHTEQCTYKIGLEIIKYYRKNVI